MQISSLEHIFFIYLSIKHLSVFKNRSRYGIKQGPTFSLLKMKHFDRLLKANWQCQPINCLNFSKAWHLGQPEWETSGSSCHINPLNAGKEGTQKIIVGPLLSNCNSFLTKISFELFSRCCCYCPLHIYLSRIGAIPVYYFNSVDLFNIYQIVVRTIKSPSIWYHDFEARIKRSQGPLQCEEEG